MTDYEIKILAIRYAIRANLEHDYYNYGIVTNNVTKLIDGAKQIEAYLKGEKTNENV